MSDRAVAIERKLLGIVLMWPHRMPEAQDLVEADWFSRDAHRLLWRYLTARGPWEDIIQVIEDVGATELESWGGAAYVSALAEEVSSDEILPWLIGKLDREHKRKQLKDLSEHVSEHIADDPEILLGQVQDRTRAISASERSGWLNGEILATRAIEDVRVRMQARVEGRATGWPTGLPGLDRMLGGFAAPQYWVLGGRPKMGKSALALQMALYQAACGRHVAYVSLELPAATLTRRALVHLSGIPADLVRDGRLTREEWSRVDQASEDLYALGKRFVVDDRPASPMQLRARLLTLRQRQEVDLVVIDYLQLVQRDQGTRYGGRAEEIGAASHVVQATLKELCACGLVLCSLSRAVEGRLDKRPQASDLRESGDIESDADAVVMLYREEVYTETRRGEMEVIVRLARHGETGTVQTRWDGARQGVRE